MTSYPPTRSSDVTLQCIGQEAILYDRRHGRAHVLNESAAHIWELCDGRASLDDIVSAFAASYGVPPSDIRDDAVNIIMTFHELGMLD